MCNDVRILSIFMLVFLYFKLLYKSDYSSKKISKLNLIFMYYIVTFKYCQMKIYVNLYLKYFGI